MLLIIHKYLVINEGSNTNYTQIKRNMAFDEAKQIIKMKQ